MEAKVTSTREDVQKRISDKLRETSNAQVGAEIRKGTAIEQEMIAAEQLAPEQAKPLLSEDKSAPKLEKKGPGRPRGTYKKKKTIKEKKPDGTTTETVSEEEHEKPPVEQTDFLTPVINTVFVPGIAYLTKKDAENLRITDAQSKEAAKLMPPNADLIKPSWPAYLAMLVLAVAGNAMAAPKKSAETEQLAEMKKALLKAAEVEGLKKEILEIQKKMSDIHSSMEKMYVARNGNDENIRNKTWTEAIVLQ